MRAVMVMTIVGFLGILVLPGVLMAARSAAGVVVVEPVDEQRTLAPLPTPAFADLFDRDARFGRDFQAWFDDHYGARDLLVRLENQIDYSLFDTAERVVIGADGWLYYRSVIDARRRTHAISGDLVDRLFGEYDALYESLAARGIQLVVLTSPLKPTIYPEHLPDDVPRYEETPFQELRRFLNGHDGIVHIDAQPLLVSLKDEGPVFHRTDFHWNEPAAAAVSRELVNRLAAREGTAAPWRDDLSVVERPYSGGQSRFMPLLRPLGETSLFVERDEPLPATGDPEGPWIDVYRAEPGAGRRLPPTAVYHDSFWNAMTAAGVEGYFETLRRTRTRHATLQQALASLPPDTRYFVLEFIESRLTEQLVLGLLPRRAE